jgi:hypothetical protein
LTKEMALLRETLNYCQRGYWNSEREDFSKVKVYLLATSSRLALGPTQPPTQWVPGDPSPGVKRLGREVNY